MMPDAPNPATRRALDVLAPIANVIGIPDWADDEAVYLAADGEDLGFIRLGHLRAVTQLAADIRAGSIHVCTAEEAKSRHIDAARILEAMEGGGFWRTCSGCCELEDGQNVHGYPHSATFKCTLGGGCGECGGLGAIWDTTDYGAMADGIMANEARWTAEQKVLEAARTYRDAAKTKGPILDVIDVAHAALCELEDAALALPALPHGGGE